MGLMNNTVVLKNNYELWKKMYEDEKNNLIKLFNEDSFIVEHVGSTAINGLLSKPIIDIVVGVNSFTEVDKYKKKLNEVYTINEDYNKKEILLVKEKDNETFYLIHILLKNDTRFKNMIRFRNILLNNPTIKKEYNDLKVELAKKYYDDRKNYTKAKSSFIEKVLKGISLRKMEDNDNEYEKIYNWCQNKYVYDWFEQRILSFDEIKEKYKRKIELKKQDLFVIQFNNQDIGLVQIYKYEKDLLFSDLNCYKKPYEYDIFIGVEEYLSKGIGTQVVNLVNDYIYDNYMADVIILRVFKNNTRAINCYKKCGFEIIHEYIDKDTIGNNQDMLILVKEKI